MVNPLTPKISLVILLTASHTILMMLVWRIWFWRKNKSLMGVKGLTDTEANNNAKLFHSQDLISNSPYCLPYNSYDVSLENLTLESSVLVTHGS